LNELALFAGAGGGILGGHLLGWRCVCAVEYESFQTSVLLQRQNDGLVHPFPIWDDVRTFDGTKWRGIVDVVSGGFPCQDISTAGGANRKGLDGSRSGLWSEMHRIIDEVRPRFALIENSPALTFRGLDRVLADLAEIRFDARWGVFSAADVGARHQRERIWIVGINRDIGKDPTMPKRKVYAEGDHPEPLRAMQGEWWKTEDRMAGASDGMAHWVDRFGAIGNGQVPAVVVRAWKSLIGDV
jgi:DNA (cytosine-5)-methyltransferase 1